MNRDEALARITEPFDVAIIGGGATGLGAAVDAASRGYRTVLLEARDFAKGTSSRSTKLVHGGVRYLAQGHIGLVREALRERGRLRKNAPHLVVDLPFVVPAYDFWSGPYFGVGLKLYDVLSGKQRMGRSRSLSREEVLERIPTAKPEGLRGGILYFDGQFDDARLAVTLACTAWEKGATLLNYAPVTRLIRSGERLSGLAFRDNETGREHTLQAKVIINATGVFADEIRRMDEPDAAPTVLPSQGAHIVLPQKFLPSANALIIPRTDDGRVVFLIPWKGRVLVGTTDHEVDRIEVEPRAAEEEIELLVDHAARYLSLPLQRSDILSTFAGLRPLVRPRTNSGETRSVSRDHQIFTSSHGLLTIVGGKWTTYRKMAEDVVNQAVKIGQLEPRPCPTADMPLHGAPVVSPSASTSPATAAPSVDPLDPLAVYGTDSHEVRALAVADPSLAARLHPRLPVIGAQIVYAARKEMARTVEDALARRTRALLLDADAAAAAAPAAAALMARELRRSADWQRAQVEDFSRLCRNSLHASSDRPGNGSARVARR
ncbi:MAG: glycerol-3-phosphate dehydrogenase/oxidase [Myxococcaceae bacterium]|nr:glycerol-3-phosphate dehydrogenase/oxidase [Myxococcaceae bacterium]